MANTSRNFVGGKMNKVLDERVVPNGEYIDALNIRMGSTENSEIGVIENTKGNDRLTTLTYVDGTPLSSDAICIGAIDDSSNETLYWFVHDPSFTVGATGKLDLIVSFNTNTNILTYHVISVDDGSGLRTTLNFDPNYLITGVNKVDDLVFFTDDFNQPRFFNIRKYYPVPSLNIDAFTEESILVVKKPPTESPSIEPIDVVGQENFLNERFICFAYRYKYQDGEYSATSQWSEPSFVPQFFDYERDTFLNKGMINSYNGCLITYNTGGPLVVGIDLLFKETDSNIIKVIEKLDKAVLGIADNVNATYTFSNSKIYTILPESELLRLYDNVPLQAKAQAVMGNRLMYGNYVEGYDMKDSNGNPVNLEYQSNLISEEINNRFLNDTTQTGNYNIDVPTAVQESVLKVDVSSIPSGSLKANGILTIYIRAEIESTSPVTSATGTFDFTFVYQLPDDYVDFASLVADPSFQDSVGTISNIQPVSLACSNGITFTDLFNCNATNSITYLSQAHVKHRSGISQLDEPILTYVIGSDLYIQIPAIEYVDNPTNITSTLYGYFKVSAAEVTYQEYGIASSLHSNRDYDIGIVYMDNFNRSTTALVSPNNTVYVPCGNSDLKNTIQVTIPTTQIAPSWATRYKFVIKPNAEGYETIYTNIFYPEPSANEFVWFLLEGENAKKVEVGDRYIVKADSNGPIATCAYATVLDKNVFGTGFFTSGSPNGVYMKILPSEFLAEPPTNATFYRTNDDGAGYNDNPTGDAYPFTNIDISAAALPPDTNGYQIPSGTKVKFRVEHRRKGVGNSCEARNQDYEGNFVANFDYVTFKDFFDNNIAQTLNIAPYKSCYNSACSDNQYNPNMFTGLTYSSPFNIQVNYFQFQEDGAGNPINIWVTGTKACSPSNSDRRKAYVYVYLTIIRGGVPIIFETLPKDSNPDIYYENHLSFPINSLGEHQGNVQNQVFSTNQSAIVNTEFFNCYTFGNGAESYKIRDSIIGRQLTLGNRVTSVSAQDYKRADRYADITYSGIYNNESNVNKLNEFNLGLLNYKPLEDSFGPIYKMDGRETDVLVLQEDKISYVLAGKNLLSDAAAGGAITSIPEVLGTQIARVEKYGISFNPESYVQWGYDRYFTDAKRGVVLQLKGGSYSSDQLQVVSEFGMRTWFRDMFLGAFSTQKLGGFDPYMNEYVLSSNEREVVENIECVDCGLQQTFVLSGNETEVLNYCINLLQQIGLVTVTWTVFSASTDPSDGFEIFVTYNGNTYSSGATATSGLFSFQKDLIDVDTADLSITMKGDFVLGIVVSCPIPQEMNIVEIVLTNNIDSGYATYAQYRYTNGTYSSPLQSRFVTFASGTGSPLVSWYNVVTGAVGTGGFPPAGSNMRMFNNKIPPFATFDFSTLDDKFKYYRSNISYGNNPVDLNTLLSLASNAVPILGSSPVHYADFTVPPTGNYLYLIWDYRASNTNLLCYGSDSVESCCSCESCDVNDCVTVQIVNNSELSYAAVTFNGGLCDEGTPISVELEPAETVSICVINSSPLYSVALGNPTVNVLSCSCNVDSCYYYFVINSCNEPQVASTSFAGWTIDGNDFATNYQAILSGYGVNASNMANLGLSNNLITNQGVVVWFKGITPPPPYVGYIADSLGNPINYTWSSAKCDEACWKLLYQTFNLPSNKVAYLDSIGMQMVNGLATISQIDCLATFGSYLDASNPSDMITLQTYLRSIYGNQLTVYSVDNGTGYYDIYVNNVYDFGGWQFVGDFTGISQNSGWLGFTTVCPIPPDCQPDPVDYSGIYHNWTGLSYDWTYVTQQIVGTNYPIDILVQVSGGPYCSATAPNDMILYYRRDITPPPYAITTPNTSPSTQGFTAITFTSGSSAAQTIPSVLPNEYITFAVISLTPPLCSSSANPSIFNVVLRNADAGCLGDVITTFTAKSCINLSGLAPCP